MHHKTHHPIFRDCTLPLHFSEETKRGLLLAMVEADHTIAEGHLVKPTEALAIACRDEHINQTLYSISQHAADETGGDSEEILRLLECYHPEYA